MSHLEEGQLHELLDGELDAPARAAALAHLATCERCKAAYDEAAAFLAESDSLIEMVQLPVAVENRKTEVDNAPSTSDFALSASSTQRTRRLTTMRTLAWAASLIVAAGIGWYGSGLNRAVSGKAASEVTAVTVLADSPVAGAPPLPSPATAPERLKPAEPTAPAAEKELSRRRAPTQTMDKAGPDDALAAAANSQPAVTLAEEPKAEASGMMAQRATPAAAPPAAFAPLVSRDERQSEADNQGSRTGSALAGADRAATAKQLAAPTTFRVIGMEEAVRILGGSIRLIDGLTPTRVMAGRVTRGDRAATVRVVYQDPPGRELWLDQRREASLGDGRADAATALLPGDTLMVVREQGVRSLDWADQTGFLLRLTGYLPADSLQHLQLRVR